MIFIASDDQRLSGFCSLFGIGEGDLRQRLNEPEFQGFLLDALLANETELMTFAQENGIKPESIMMARSKLPGFSA